MDNTKYELSIIIDALKVMMTTKQREGEKLVEYTQTLRIAKEVLESHIRGTLIFNQVCQRDGRVHRQGLGKF